MDFLSATTTSTNAQPILKNLSGIPGFQISVHRVWPPLAWELDVVCEIQPSDICVESIVAQRENLPLSRFSDRIVLQEYCEACFCLFSLTLVIIDYTLDHVPIDRFHSIFSLWQLEGINITILLADCITWSFALQFLWWKMLWSPSISN